MKKERLIQNIECGNIFPLTAGGMQAAYIEAQELYDIGDDTNACDFWEYYQIIEV